MTPFEIVLFKEFTHMKAMVKPFCDMYKHYPKADNPASIEEYMKNVDAREAYMKAFYFVTNSHWGYDYWKQMQADFNDYISSNPEGLEKEPWWFLHGRYKVLRTNWDITDLNKYWHLENRQTAAKRLGIELPEWIGDDEFAWEMKEKKPKPTPVLTPTPVPTPEPAKEKKSDDDFGDLLGKFEFVDVSPKRQLKKDEISINNSKVKHAITFNRHSSSEFKSRGGYEYAALLIDENSGRAAIMLNDIKGVPVTDGRGNSVINSKVMVEKIVDAMEIKEKYSVLKIEEAMRTEEQVMYILSKINN